MNQLEEFFVFKAQKGLKKRLAELKYPIDQKVYEDRLAFEISIILKTGFTGYFLIVSDFISWSRRNGIRVGPGRGSAAGALVAYSLGITNLDPIKYELYFERFLNPERISPPDIDVDFDKEKRHLVIEYVKQRYGNDKVAQIGTFGTFKAKAAIRAVARTLGLPISTADNLSKMYPKPLHGKEIPFKKALEDVRELKDFYDDPSCPEGQILRWTEKVEGRVASFGIHASGVVIGNDSLCKLLPLARGREGEVVTQWDMGRVEDIGLIKFDFLGLKTLTLIQKAIDIIKERHQVDIDVDALDLDDPEVYQSLRDGDTCGVFQLEASTGMQDLLVKIRPTNIEDITALIAMYRPGPLGSPKMQEYLDWRAGVSTPRYDHEDLRPSLALTGGWLVYQEQLLRIARDLAGYTLAEADLLRKAVGKKKEKEMKAQEAKFKKGMETNGYSNSLANKLWDEFLAFADYGFNKSHAAAYALLVYQTAYLKTHYPVEYMAAALTCDINNPDQMMIYLGECRRMGIKVLPPDINESQSLFSVTGDKEIRFGLSAIKFLGEEPVSHILDAKKTGRFDSMFNFAERVDLGKINKKKLESLALAGAFDEFGFTRSSLLNGIESIINYKSEVKKYESKLETFNKKVLAAAERLKEIEGGSKAKPFKTPESPAVPEKPRALPMAEMPKRDLLKYEKELTGFYISGHPLDVYEKMVKHTGFTIHGLKEDETQPRFVELIGVVNSIETKETKNKQIMGFANFEDKTGSLGITMFSNLWRSTGSSLQDGQVVKVMGEVEYIDGESGTIPSSIKVKSLDILPLLDPEDAKPIDLIVPLQETIVTKVHETLERYSGTAYRVNVSFRAADGTIIKADKQFLINNQDTSFKSDVYKIIHSKE